MAIKAFELFGTIELKDQKLKSGLQAATHEFQQFETKAKGHLKNVENSFSKFGSNFNQGFLSSFNIQRGSGLGSLLGSAGGNLLQSGVKALYGHVTDAMQAGMDFADKVQAWKFGFTSLMNDEAKGVAHLRELMKFGKDSPFETQDVIDYAQGLEAVKVKASEVIPMLEGMGGALAKAGKFNKENLFGTYTAIQQILSKGTVSAEEMQRQLGQYIPNPYGYAARGFNRLGYRDDKGHEFTDPSIRQYSSDGRFNPDAFVRIMVDQFREESKGLLEKFVSGTISGTQAQLEDTKLFLFAQSMLGGGDMLGTPGGAYAQRLQNLKTQTQLYSGPEAQKIGSHLGDTASLYYKAVGTLEENAFQSDWFTDLLHGDTASANKKLEQLGGFIPEGLGKGIFSGAKMVVDAADSTLGTNIWKSLEDFWETHSPSKRSERMGAAVGEGFRIGLEKALSDPRVKAMLDVIGFSEGTDKRHGYATKVGGANQGDLSQKNRSIVNLGGGLKSSASGRYQFLNKTWDSLAEQLGLTDFSEHSQDLAAVKLLSDSGALKKLQAGDFQGAVTAARKTWASFPGAGYGQGERSMGSLEKVFANSLAVGGSPVTARNPVPVAIVDFGNSVAVDLKTMRPAQSLPMVGGGRLPSLQTPVGLIKDTVPVNAGSIYAQEQPLKTSMVYLTESALMLKKPLDLLGDSATSATAGLAGLSKEQLEAEFGPAIKDGGKKKKKDKLFDSAFTREGVAGDFESGLTGLLGNLGWEKPGSLAKQFGIGLLRDIQGRMAHDFSAMITGAIFGGRGEDGKLTGGLFGGKGFDLGGIFSGISGLFGKLFGGFRASGGSMSSGRFYVAGENGRELIAGPGHVYNNRETEQMMNGGGGSDPHYTIVAIGDREVGRAVDAYRNTGRGRRARLIEGRYNRKIMAHA